MSNPPAFIPSFGRRKGHRLKPSRHNLMETLLPRLLISDSNPFTPTTKPLWFEIGYGSGEHLQAQAIANPGVQFIGCEPYINGVAKLLATIEEQSITNIRLYDGDARLLLEQLPDSSLERLFILFPDPWPKNRHHKRRIINEQSIPLFHQKLKPGGLLRIATDHVDYSTWILEHMVIAQGFDWQAKTPTGWQTPPAGWVTTRYQAKAIAEGRVAVFLDFHKKLG